MSITATRAIDPRAETTATWWSRSRGSVVGFAIGGGERGVIAAGPPVLEWVELDGDHVAHLERGAIQTAALHVGDVRHLHRPVHGLAVLTLHVEVEEDMGIPIGDGRDGTLDGDLAA